MSVLFLKIYDFFSKNRFFLYSTVFLLVAVFTYLSLQINFSEDITDVLPRNQEMKKYIEFFDATKSNNKIIIILQAENAHDTSVRKMILSASALAENIRKELMPEYVKSMTVKVADESYSNLSDIIWKYIPIFLRDEDYNLLKKLPDTAFVDSLLQKNFRMLNSPAGFYLKKQIQNDPAGILFAALKNIKLSGIGNNYSIYDGYILSKDKKHLLMFLSSANSGSETKKNNILIQKLDKIIKENEKLSVTSGLKIYYYGLPATSVCNANRMKKDFYITIIIALIVLTIFFRYFFKDVKIIFLLFVPVIFGALFSLALVQIFSPNISLIAIGAGSIILGIAVNYSLHFFTHLRHEQNVRQTLKDLVSPLTIGSITTIGAFLGLTMTQSKLLYDFGLFASLCLLGGILFTLIFLPLMVKQNPQSTEISLNFIDRVSSYSFEKNKYILISIVLLTVFFAFMAGNVSFESNLNAMNYTSDELKKADQVLHTISDSSLNQIYVISKGKNIDEALKNNEKLQEKIKYLQQKHVVAQVSGVNDIIMSQAKQQERIHKWKHFWTDEKKLQVQNTFRYSARKNNFKENAFDAFFDVLDKNYQEISRNDLLLLEEQFASEYISQDSENTYILTTLRVNPKNKELVLNQIPEDEKTVVIENQSMFTKFADALISDFNTVLWISSMLVFVFLLFSYGRIELALIAFTPMFISWVWILGIMSLLQIKFTVFSVIISAFIFGLGDDYSIFIMDGLLQEYKSGKKFLSSHKTAVFLSAFTMLVGVGVLILAKHPALRSIAILTIIGMFSVVFLSYVVAPVLFRMLVHHKHKKRRFPVTLGNFLYACVFYGYFLIGCIITIILTLGVYKWLPLKKHRKQYLLHYTLMLVCRSTIFVMFLAKKRYINYDKNKFNKPSVIICNHQSIIDIPLLLQFSPKLIMVTNDRWYNATLLGLIIRLSGFMTASIGYDAIAELFEPYIKRGYSIIVFPEGSRSPDAKIGRFHKGAFYLAEKLKLGIQPLLIHGTADYVAKGELIGRKSCITVKFLDRIEPENNAFGNTYQERAKNIKRLYEIEHEKILENYRMPSYYKDLLVKNFIYKGPVLEWYTRIKLRLEKNYEIYHKIIPRDAEIMDIGCGYGYLSMMLGFSSPTRTILGIDYDEDKIAVAANCASKPLNVSYECADALEYEYTNKDVFILSDVLHYLNREQQQTLILKLLDKLNPGGKLIIREGDKENVSKHKITKFTEFLSTNIGFNKTKEKRLCYVSSSMIEQLALQKGYSVQIIDNSKLNSNVLFVLTSINN